MIIMWEYRDYAELYHHGILGMKWGKRNGPPYPLGESQKSSAEKHAKSVSPKKAERQRKKAERQRIRRVYKEALNGYREIMNGYAKAYENHKRDFKRSEAYKKLKFIEKGYAFSLNGPGTKYVENEMLSYSKKVLPKLKRISHDVSTLSEWRQLSFPEFVRNFEAIKRKTAYKISSEMHKQLVDEELQRQMMQQMQEEMVRQFAQQAQQFTQQQALLAASMPF